MPKCKSCGDEIAFVKSLSGAWIPVNGLEAETYYLHMNDRREPQMVIVTENGATFRGRIGKANDNGTTQLRGRESHFATCPHPDQHRKKKE